MNLITIIVPVYNVEKYLFECVDSLLNQTYKNLEIILVDDGSKDDSGKICDYYTEKDSRIKVIHKKNEGLGYARNSGLEVAKGKYVTFIDSDDKADEDLVENLISEIIKTQCDTCIGGFKRLNENGTYSFIEQYEDDLFEGNDVYEKLFARMLGSSPDKHDSIRMSVWNVMYSMDIIKRHNIRFPSEREFISEDIIWDAVYYKYSNKVKVIGSTSYNYRITPGSLTQKYKPDMLDKICILYNEVGNLISWEKTKVIRLQRQFFVNLRTCIKQESFVALRKNSEIKDRIKLIVNNELVQSVSADYSKVIKQRKQKIFVNLIKYKCVNIIFWMIKTGRL